VPNYILSASKFDNIIPFITSEGQKESKIFYKSLDKKTEKLKAFPQTQII
jgi:hypothetical protein